MDASSFIYDSSLTLNLFSMNLGMIKIYNAYLKYKQKKEKKKKSKNK